MTCCPPPPRGGARGRRGFGPGAPGRAGGGGGGQPFTWPALTQGAESCQRGMNKCTGSPGQQWWFPPQTSVKTASAASTEGE